MNILLLINKSKEHLFSALNMSIPSCHRDPKTPNLKMLVTIDYLNNLVGDGAGRGRAVAATAAASTRKATC